MDEVESLGGVPAATERDLTLILALVYVGWYSTHMGRMEDALAAWERCEEMYEKTGVPPLPGAATDPALGFSYNAWTEGEYDGGVAFARRRWPGVWPLPSAS